MKKLILLPIAAAVLVGCASTGPSQYQMYVAAHQASVEASAAASIARTQAIQMIAQSGDATAKAVAIVTLQNETAGGSSSASAVQPPPTVGDQVFRWASLLVPSLTTVYGINRTADVAIVNSNNNLASQQNSNSTMVDLVRDRTPVTTLQPGETGARLGDGQVVPN